MKRLLLLLLLVSSAHGTTFNTDGSIADVQAKVNSAVHGDTVIVPVGSFTWTTTLTITHNITLIGGGIGQTIITDGANPSTLLSYTVSNNANVGRISGFTFQSGSGHSATNANIIITGNSGTIANFRMDHVYTHDLYGRPLRITGSVFGVSDHCQFDTLHSSGCVDVGHPSFLGVGSYGDNSWAQPTNFGSVQAFYFEDDTFDGFSDVTAIDMNSDSGGGRAVVRKSTILRSVVGNHGTETSQRNRSARSLECYQNTFKAWSPLPSPTPVQPPPNTLHDKAMYIRGGTAVIWGNTFTSISGSGGYDSMVKMACYRVYGAPPPWGSPDGTNVWDLNDTNGIGGTSLYASGTANGGSSLTMTVSGTPFTVHQFNNGYELKNTTTSKASVIKDTPTTSSITFASGAPVGAADMTFTNGDGYEVRKITALLDQPGRGVGDLLSGSSPTPVGWPHDALEPIRIWGNTFLGGGNNNGQSVVGAETGTVQINRDFYYSTDNTAALPGYTPLVYPHPLVNNVPLAPPPKDLHVAKNLSVIGSPL